MSTGKTCQYPSCNIIVSQGRTYCGRSHAAKDRGRVNKINREFATTLNASGVAELIANGVEGGAEVIALASEMVLSGEIPLPSEVTVFGDWSLSFDGKEEYRPSSALSYDVIDKMMRSGPVVFAIELKRAGVLSVFRDGMWTIETPDEELKEVAQESMKQIISKAIDDITYSMFVYGTAFCQQTWRNASKYELGLATHGNATKQFNVPNVPAIVHPRTVTKLHRKNKGLSFDGFSQKPSHNPMFDDDIRVPVEQSLVVPMNSHFRSLWGNSVLDLVYPLWVVYEVVIRAMLRYMERMSIPVTVGEAPSKAYVEVKGKSTPIRALDMALQIAGSVAKSNAAAIPSDRDANGNPLWGLRYLEAPGDGKIFIAVLEFIVGMILQAVMQKDTKSGVYKEGELVAEGNALSTDAIVIQIMHYFNTYWISNYSLFNKGAKGPPIRMIPQSVNRTIQELLFKLIGVAGNNPASGEFFESIDWRRIGDTSSIPMLDEEIVAERKKKRQEEAIKQQQKMFKAQAKDQPPQQQPPQSSNQPPPDNKSSDQEKLEWVNWMVETGAFRPVILGYSELESMREVLYDDEDNRIDLRDSYVRDRIGRFASKPGGGGIGDRVGIIGDTIIVDARSRDIGRAKKGGGFVKTTAKLLGLTGLGVVGVVALGVLSGSNTTTIKPGDIKPGDDPFGDNLSGKSKEEQRLEAQAKLDELMKNWPKEAFQSPEAALNFSMNQLRGMGFDVPSDIKLTTGPTEPGVGGFYDSATNTMTINPALADGLKDGDVGALWAIMHETAHAGQEFAGEDPNWGNYSEFPSSQDAWNDNGMALLEGQNDLATSVALSKAFGEPIDNNRAYGLSVSAHDLNSQIDSVVAQQELGDGITISTTILNQPYSSGLVGYPSENSVWATIAIESARQKGISPQQFLAETHSYGFSSNESHQVLVDLFGPEMEKEGFYTKSSGFLGLGGVERKWPSQSDLRRWMYNHGYIDPDLAREQMLEEAAK